MERAAFFDLDRTLLDCNSATLWMRHEWDEGNVGVRQLAQASWWLLRYSLGHGGMEHAFLQAVASLAGKEEARMAERTRAWFEGQVRHRLRRGARDAIRRHREQGDRLVIATSSSPYAAGSALEAFAFDDYVCTTFEVVDGRFTGRVAASAYGAAKAERVREWAEAHDIALERSAFYTDSMTDLALLEVVGEPVVVNPDRRLAREAVVRGWPVEDWGPCEP